MSTVDRHHGEREEDTVGLSLDTGQHLLIGHSGYEREDFRATRLRAP